MKYYLNVFMLLTFFSNGLSQEIIDINVESWLSDHQDIRESIIWVNGGNPISYINWPSILKNDLQSAVSGYMNNQFPWDLDGLPSVTLFGTDYYGISESIAWRYYISFVAHGITAEIIGLIPWSLEELNSTSVSVLFDSREMLTFLTNYNIYQFKYVTPASPEYIYKFLENNALIGSTRLETINRVIEWCKCLTHYGYMEGEDKNAAYFANWQYYGEPPVIRIIEGTIRNPPGNLDLHHYTRGCHGTVQFMRTLLQTLNIPVKYIYCSGHAQPYFVHEDLYMSHGDDPYGSCIKCNDFIIPASELLIGNSEYQSRFGSQLSSEERLNNIGFKTKILAVQYLPLCLLRLRCEANTMGYNNQECLTYMGEYMGLDREFTLEELNNTNFWSLLDNKIYNYGGCSNNNNFLDYCSRQPIPSSQKSIIDFRFYGQYGEALINNDTRTISAQIIGSYNIKYIIPHFSISEKASINYSSGSYVDFSSPRTFLVTAEDGTQNSWIVNVTPSVHGTISVTPSNREVEYIEGSTTFSITSNTNWTVTDDADWLTISPSNGNGNSLLTANYTANTTSSSRVGTITVTGTGISPQTFTVTQHHNLVLWASTTTIDVGPESGSTTFSITSNANWSITDDADWLTISPSNGNGDGTITATFEGNSSTTTRVGTIEISVIVPSTWDIWVAPQTVTVTQSAPNALSVTPGNREVGSDAGSTTITINSSISWYVHEHSGWISFDQYNGTGNLTIPVYIEANPSTETRVGIITISSWSGDISQTVNITQTGVGLSLSVNPPSITVASLEGSTGYFEVSSNTSWTVTNDVSWLDLSSVSGNGNGTLTVTTSSANTLVYSRTANITFSASGVDPIIVTVTQNGTGPYLTISPDNQLVNSNAGSTLFNISSNTTWNISDDASWLIICPTSGSGDSTLTATYTENTSTNQRVGTITITITAEGLNSQTVTVTQNPPNTLSVSPGSQNVSSDAGSTSFIITSNTNWTISDDASWLTISPEDGTGNGTLTVTYAENTSTSQRVGIITINAEGLSSQAVTVTQSAQNMLSVSPTNRNVGSDAGSTTFTINSSTSWSVSDDATWLIVVPTSGSGNGTLTATYSENTSSNQRFGTITISGEGVNAQTVTITQSCSVPLQPDLISGKQTISQGTSENYSISPVSGAISYTWTLPVGWSGNSNSTSILITTNKDAISGNISVVANNDCGSSVPSTLYVEVRACIIPQIILKWDDVLICSNVDNMFLSYQWYNGTIPIPGANDQYYVTSKQPGVYKVETIDKNGCREMSNEIT
ncbi:MAG: hypothetical protein JXB49_09625, partial [Bacteroidales bacterium]|nr:hypothetical protein [Bacteroidales bacterium]